MDLLSLQASKLPFGTRITYKGFGLWELEYPEDRVVVTGSTLEDVISEFARKWPSLLRN